MTEIIFNQPQLKDGKIIHVPKKVEKLEINKAGEDGEYLWLRMILEGGEKEETGYYKETY